VEGAVTLEEKPVEGAEIVQEILYKSADEVPPSTVRSQPDGRFAFEEVTRRGRKMELSPIQAAQATNSTYGLRLSDDMLNAAVGVPTIRLGRIVTNLMAAILRFTGRTLTTGAEMIVAFFR